MTVGVEAASAGGSSAVGCPLVRVAQPWLFASRSSSECFAKVKVLEIAPEDTGTSRCTGKTSTKEGAAALHLEPHCTLRYSMLHHDKLHFYILHYCTCATLQLEELKPKP